MVNYCYYKKYRRQGNIVTSEKATVKVNVDTVCAPLAVHRRVNSLLIALDLFLAEMNRAIGR